MLQSTAPSGVLVELHRNRKLRLQLLVEEQQYDRPVNSGEGKERRSLLEKIERRMYLGHVLKGSSKSTNYTVLFTIKACFLNPTRSLHVQYKNQTRMGSVCLLLVHTRPRLSRMLSFFSLACDGSLNRS